MGSQGRRDGRDGIIRHLPHPEHQVGGAQGVLAGFSEIQELRIQASEVSSLRAEAGQTVVEQLVISTQEASDLWLNGLTTPRLSVRMTDGSDVAIRMATNGVLNGQMDEGANLHYCGFNVADRTERYEKSEVHYYETCERMDEATEQ